MADEDELQLNELEAGPQANGDADDDSGAVRTAADLAETRTAFRNRFHGQSQKQSLQQEIQ